MEENETAPFTKISTAMIEVTKEMANFINNTMLRIAKINIVSHGMMVAILATSFTNKRGFTLLHCIFLQIIQIVFIFNIHTWMCLHKVTM